MDQVITQVSEIEPGDGGFGKYRHVFVEAKSPDWYVFHTECGKGGLSVGEDTVQKWIDEGKPFIVQRV